MAKDVLITPLDGIIQFSSSAGAGTGQIKVDNNDLVISNLVGDVLLGDGASDVFIGDGTNNVDIVFEQNGEIRDDGTGKNIIFASDDPVGAVELSGLNDVTTRIDQFIKNGDFDKAKMIIDKFQENIGKEDQLSFFNGMIFYFNGDHVNIIGEE